MGAIPGWAANQGADATGTGLVISDELATVGRLYRSNRRLLLALALLFEGPSAVAGFATLLAQRDLTRTAWTTGFGASSATAFRIPALDPLASLAWVALSIVPLVAIVLMIAAAPLAVAAGPVGRVRSVLRALFGRWRPLIAFMALMLLAFVVVGGIIVFVAIGMTPQPGAALRDPSGAIASSLLILVAIPALGVGLMYAAVRWSTAITLIGGDRFGLRAALRHSSELSGGRRIRILLLLLAAGVIAGLALAPVSFIAIVLLIQDGDVSLPVLALVGAAFVVVRVLAAPILPLTLVVLRDDLVRLGSPAR